MLQDSVWDVTILNDKEAVLGTRNYTFVVLDISGVNLRIIRKHRLPFRATAMCRYDAVTRDPCSMGVLDVRYVRKGELIIVRGSPRT